jgi:uncharacterized protein YdaT
MISMALKEIASNYIEAKAGPMASSKLAEFIRNAAKNILKPEVKKNSDYFKFYCFFSISLLSSSTLTGGKFNY